MDVKIRNLITVKTSDVSFKIENQEHFIIIFAIKPLFTNHNRPPEMDTFKLKIVASKALADKAINTLKGILMGINLDGQINEQEIAELQGWAKEQRQWVNRNPFNEFISTIELILNEENVTRDAIEDLYWLCQKYETDSYYYNAVTADLQTLQGLCHGILADGVIQDKEVHELSIWLDENEHLSSYYPYDEIRSLLLSILSDGKIDEEEITVLKAYFSQFIKLNDEFVDGKIRAETADVSIAGLCTSEPNVTFEGKTFCVTGVLKRGTRENLKRDIESLGGIATETITKKTDYLIVGDNGNPAWAFACYGRKVEKALSLRKEGHTITLIHEFDFCDIIDDLLR